MKSRVLKFILYSFLGVFVTIIAILLLIPVFFKKDIQGYVQKEMDKNINGKIVFSDFSVSCFRDFPDATLSFDNFIITGSGIFKNDSLASIKELRIVVDLLALIKNKDIDLKMLVFQQPQFRFKINKQGIANYDLVKSDSAEEEKSSKLSFEDLIITDGTLMYEDSSENIFIYSSLINLKGQAELKDNVFDLLCTSEFGKFTYVQEGIQVLKNKELAMDFNLDWDLDKNKIVFKKNSAKVNNFEFILDGSIAWTDSNFLYDLKFNTGRDDLKDLISIFPGVYPDDMKKFISEGNVAVTGWVKGEMTDDIYPAFNIDCKIKDGQLKYDSLPEKLHNIQFDMVVSNKGGLWENTSINLNKVHFDLGKNPFRGYLKIKDLKNYATSAEIKSKIDLAQLNKIFPIKDFELKGKFNSAIKINGIFDKENGKFPEMDAQLNLVDGFIKSNEFPVTMENIHLDATVNNSSGAWQETRIHLDTFTYQMDEQPFVIEGLVSDLNFDLFIKGKFSLEKVSTLFTFEDMIFKGEADADLEARGNFRDFSKVVVDGKLGLNKFFFSSPQFPDGISLEKGILTLDKDKVFLDDVNGKFAGTDFKVHGHLYDYISCFYNENIKVKGDMLFECDSLNVLSWINAYKEIPSEEDENTISVFRIPTGIDFVFDSDIKHLDYDDIIINNLKGEISFHDGKMSVMETGFNTIGSKISINGHYNTKPNDVEFDLELDINDLDINKAHQHFAFVRTLAPAAEHTYGLISIQYKLKGNHNEKFEIDYSSLDGAGVISIAEAQVNNMKLFSHIGHVSKKEKLKNPVLNSIVMQTSVNDGRLLVRPFTFKMAGLDTELEGFTDFNGEMKLVCRIEFLKDKIKIPFHIEGKYDDPIVRIGKGHEEMILALEKE